MKDFFKRLFSSFDWYLIIAIVPILLAGLSVMFGFLEKDDGIFFHQIAWIAVSFCAMSVVSLIDGRMFRKTPLIVGLYIFSLSLLVLVLFFGVTINGSRNWFSFGGFSFQPSDISKIIIIIVLAKYFSRRHIEIARAKHIFISGIYFLIPFFLILLEPDFGSAIIFFVIWLGMSLVAGISKKHLITIFVGCVLASSVLWFYVFKTYQKARIINFINPLTDISGTGYNAYQSVVSIGSGQIFGKGIGFGTQSRLQYLPEFKTDFVFAAFSEEAGFVGSLIILICYLIVLSRIINIAQKGATNFESLFATGFAILIGIHICVNVGMNVGLLPVTGITLPFMSYGGSSLLSLFIGLGILFSFKRYERRVDYNYMRNVSDEF